MLKVMTYAVAATSWLGTASACGNRRLRTRCRRLSRSPLEGEDEGSADLHAGLEAPLLAQAHQPVALRAGQPFEPAIDRVAGLLTH